MSMKMFNSLENLPYADHQLALALGNFDGVHVGHQQLLNEMVEYAREQQKVPAVFLFHPHPQHVLRPEQSLKMLLDIGKKVEMLAALGIEAAFIIPFDHTMAALSAEEFARSVLVARLRVAAVFVGFNYRFGRQAAGTPELLEQFGEKHGFAVMVMPPVYVDETLVSSTTIRASLETGDIARARQLLGYWPLIRGVVVPGDRRGRQLGFPTANIATAADLIVPGSGVYAGSAKVDGRRYVAVVNIGFRPTFGEGSDQVIEAHLVDYRNSAYGWPIEIEIYKKLRPERRFKSAAALARQIRIDIREAVAIGSGRRLEQDGKSPVDKIYIKDRL
jgi:riboflavin kinase/FMN adenylyltransferase